MALGDRSWFNRRRRGVLVASIQHATPAIPCSVAVLLSLIISGSTVALADDRMADLYLGEIKPLLRAKCYSCHGGLEQESGLRVDTVAALLAGGDSGPAVVAGEAGNSEIVARVEANDLGVRMPPEGEPMTAAQIDTLRRWIDAGAEAPAAETPQRDADSHWAFQPLPAVDPPAAQSDRTANHPVDRFVNQKLRDAGITPAPVAESTTLVRRLYLDLHGLPPTPAELRRWSATINTNPAGLQRLVDTLLASPRYGERWAQHWLDVVRYADTHGYEVNTPRPNAWPYRDYVIAAFNDDKPYDRFVFEQLAGDTFEQDAATGFMVASAVLLPGQIGKDEASMRLARQDALDEIVVGTSATFLALTVGCARCHDHKFDPITQRDYYSMQAFFAGVEYGERPLPVDAEAGEESADETLVFAGTFREPDNTYLLNRGDPEQPGEPIVPAVLSALGSIRLADDASEQQRRLALARWITAPDHPLTARVMVNRIWQYHFGTGLVETSSDFGLSGAEPSHPQLLDWLSAQFISSGWSIKHLHRLILSSEAYRRSSVWSPPSHDATTDDADSETVVAHPSRFDSDNRLLWRFPSRRLEAEAIRDSILQASGSLNRSMGGPGFDFFQSRGGLSGFPPVESFAADGHRRMIYAHKVRMEKIPVFGAFDCPDAGLATPRRTDSTTAIQALNLFNSRFVIEQAETFAERVARETDGSLRSQVKHAFWIALGRTPREEEWPEVKRTVDSFGMSTLCRVLLNSNEFLFMP